MKKKIIPGLSAYPVLFLFMGLYIVYTIQVGTARPNDIIRLHQVEILREHSGSTSSGSSPTSP